jgi:pyrimidine-nucleoside phosphorylase
MLFMAGKGTIEECESVVRESVKNGSAMKKFEEMVRAQGGNLSNFEMDYSNGSKVRYEVISKTDGYIESMNTEGLGKAAMILGAGRERKEDKIDYEAGIILGKKTNDKISKGDVLAVFYSSDLKKCKEAEQIFDSSLKIGIHEPKKMPIIIAKVTSDGIQNF